MIELLFIFFGTVQILVATYLTFTFHTIRKKSPTKSSAYPYISVVIPVRNEAQNLHNLLEDLNQISYKGNFEVIVVNDHSEDSTEDIVKKFTPQYPLTYFTLPSHQKGKKRAITSGVSKAKGSWILTTDGDCRIPKNWLTTHALAIDAETKMVISSVKMDFHNLFEALQSYDFAILMGFGACLVHLRVPSMCNGANLFYKKDIFLEVGAYDDNIEIPSGDDEFLLLKIFKKYKNAIAFNAHPDSVVHTSAKVSLKALLNQRKRWISKWTYHKNSRISLFILYVLADSLVMMSVLVGIVLNMLNPFLLLIFIMRMVTKYIFVKKVNSILKLPVNGATALLYEGVYPFFVLLLTLHAVSGNYTWKGRKYKKND